MAALDRALPGLVIGLLGDLQVSVDGRPVRLTTGRLRTVLVMLAMSAGQTVPLDRLAAGVWSDEPPDNARRTLQTYVSRLRAAVGEALIETRPAGMVLHVDPDNVDALRFVRLLDQARQVPDADGERPLLDAALGLWRGEPFAGVASRWLAQAQAPRLTERRLAALERRIDLDLADGRHGELVPRLTELAARYPLREPLWVRLLVALDRAGRQAEALEQYEQVRVRLTDELGADPGAELRRVHADLLAGRPAAAISTPRAAPRTGRPERPATPRQLPADVASFVGRGAELARIERLDATSTVPVAAIDGMAGVGKTALAVHAAHRLAGRYPDGQVFLNLHGFTEGVAPVDPGEALDRLLRTLGVPASEIPPDLDDRAALYRSRLAGTRMLVLLDNAADEAQIAPLLPGAPGCLVLVTSRRRLLGLDLAHPVSLDVLPLAEAVALFAHTVGEHRIGAADAVPLAEVVELCGRLPLAIRVGAARLRARPTRTVAHLAARLRDEHRLAELEAGQRSLTAALDLSYRQLPPDLRHAYRLLGLHPGGDLAAVAAAALFDVPAPVARRLLDKLVDDHLLQEHAAGRYRPHDLVRHHARHRAGRDQPAAAGEAALARLCAHYAASATAAMDAAYPYERDRRPRLTQPASAAPGLADPRQATAWLDTELGNLLATALHAAEHGRPDHALHLSATLHCHLLTRGRFTSSGTLHTRALEIARSAGDRPAELRALLCLGEMFQQQGLHDRAAASYQRALGIARATGDHTGHLDALAGLGDVGYLRGRYEDATECFGTALDLARRIGDGAGELDALRGLGWVNRLRNRPDRAAAHLTQALATAQRIRNRTGEFYTLSSLGHLHLMQRRYGPAEESFRQALAVARELGHHTGPLSAQCGLGHVHLAHGRHGEAEQSYRAVLGLAQETGSRNWQFEALHALGRLCLAAGRSADALDYQAQALDLATELGQHGDQARAHDGLAHAYRSTGDRDLAGKHWQQALDLLAVLGVHQTEDGVASAADIQSHLAGLDAR